MSLETKSLANIVKVEIKTIEDVPKVYSWETASKAAVKPYLSEGSEEFLRVKNTILATNRFEDIVIGYDIEFEDNTFIAEVFSLVDGGTLVYDEIDTDKLVSYNAPTVGNVVERTMFDLAIYTEEKDIDGYAKSYAKLILKNCKGKPAEFDLEDGQFFVPKLTVSSRPKAGESPISIEFIDEL